MNNKNCEYLPSFGRRVGRKIRSQKQFLLDDVLPALLISNPKEYVQKHNKIWLEIGYGCGEHLAHRAKNNPDVSFIGCEVYAHGIAALVQEVSDEKIQNISLFTEDARLLIDDLPDKSVDRVFILFPDPWPKRRHYKRRIINQETLDKLHRILKDDGRLNLATDHPEYARWMLAHIIHHDKFHWLANKPDDWKTPPKGHIKTRYEEKLKADHPPVFLNFKK